MVFTADFCLCGGDAWCCGGDLVEVVVAALRGGLWACLEVV